MKDPTSNIQSPEKLQTPIFKGLATQLDGSEQIGRARTLDLLWSLDVGCWRSCCCFFLLALITNSPAAETLTNQTHWSLQPITRPAVPPLANPKWRPRNPIDNFVFDKLAAAKLSPSPDASRRILIRRLYFDLIGLPPTPAEVRAFERDPSANAYEKVVDRLMASPQYGERWARHWLDVVRFAETHGFEMNQPRSTAWRYRDYVIEALNEDKPYDRFIIEQLAGDLFSEDAATGFLVGGPWDQVKSPDPILTSAQRADELHDMVSTIGSAFLGLTVGCARCHNHKFDPIPQLDYYAIKACLSGVQHGERNLYTPELAAQKKEAELCSNKLASLESGLTRFEPLAFTGRLTLIDPEPSFGSHATQLLKRATRATYSAGTSRGEGDDPGDLERMPCFTRGFLVWSNFANTPVFAYEPHLEGRFHLWLSWACRPEANARDASYLLDRDGQLDTTNDQVEIARIDQQHFADGTDAATNKNLWSGFFDAGIWQLATSNKIVLCAAPSHSSVTAGILALVEEEPSTEPSLSPKERAGVKFGRKASRVEPLNLRTARVFSLSSTGSTGGEGWGEEAVLVPLRFTLRRNAASESPLTSAPPTGLEKAATTSTGIVTINQPDLLAPAEEVSLSPRERAGVRGNAVSESPLASVPTTSSERRASAHFLRSAVNARRNTERFSPIQVKRLRFTITRTTDAEPCLDELEVYTTGPNPTNIALATFGTKPTASSVFPNADIHRLEHINDGKVGNSHSWISNERGKGWIELEFPTLVTIDRVVWGRDREQQFSDRLPLEYRIEVALDSNDWRLVASSRDRIPYVAGRSPSLDVSLKGLSQSNAQELRDLLSNRTQLEARLKELSNLPMVYAGKFTEKPDPVHRLARGDPMQERELIEPAALSAIQVGFHLDASPISPVSSQTNPGEIESVEKSEPQSHTLAFQTLTADQQRRLALADWIADPSNPLPARVIVNRLWQHHFGEGLVSTPSDFGKKGAAPSHPELLDWLASELVYPTVSIESMRFDWRNNAASTLRRSDASKPWSLKHIHRLIVTSATYRQASASRSDAFAADAASRLLWRYPPQRLDAEPLRDSILAISGKLNLTPGGPGFSVFEPNDNYVRVYNPRKDFGPSEWRRMIYMTKVRMQQDSTFGAFDCPDGGQIAPKRMRSTTPLQALNLLNSEFLLQQSAFFAQRLEREAGKTVKAQVRLAFQLAYNRDPESRESRAARSFVATHGLLLFCRALFNSNELIFVE